METVHLRRFYNNFASVRSSVTPPLPVPGMDTEAVLVETYEAGTHHFPTHSSLKESCVLSKTCLRCFCTELWALQQRFA